MASSSSRRLRRTERRDLRFHKRLNNLEASPRPSGGSLAGIGAFIQLQYIGARGVDSQSNANSMLTIIKILDQDDYWLALQKPGDAPKIFLFTYHDESPRRDVLPVIRRLLQPIVPGQRIRTITCNLTTTFDCLRRKRETGKPVRISVKGSSRLYTFRQGDSESDFLKFALKHCPHFLRDFSAGNAGPKAKLEIIP